MEPEGPLYFLSFKLAEIQVIVKSVLIQQLLVGSLLDDFAIIDHDNPIGIPDGAQPVGDHKTCAALHKVKQGFLDAYLGAGIHTAGGFIQDQDPRIRKDGACNGKQLPLTLAQVARPLG